MRTILFLFIFPSICFGASTATTCDPTDCKLMLHMNGADGSTTFLDSSTSSHTLTANGNAQLDTAQKKFGTASGLFDGTGDYLSASDSNDWDLSSSNFTIDTQVRFNSDEDSIFIAHDDFDVQRDWQFYYLASTHKLSFFWTTDGTTGTRVIRSVDWTPNTSTWYHVALVRSGTNLYFFVDGTQVGTTQAMSATVNSGTASVYIGGAAGGTDLNGWLDELRFVKGTAVWTSNFTAPSSEYTIPSTNTGNFFQILN